ncbi:MAG: hypothetical protein K2L62_04850, partial [Muribaculaceae bacterium]|nr:hypothetical protein [Muribaculaceae bacterium]
PAVIDFDNDGRPDFLSRKDETVISVNPEGTIATRHLATMTMNEYLGIIPPGPNPLGSGLSIVGDGAGQPAVFASYIQTDINGDGYPDFVDAASGKYYMNLGDGRFVTDSFNGTLLFRDFDDDGINDFLLYDSKQKSISVVLNRIGQDAVVNKLFSGLNCGSDIWCRDFDKDGDIDILVPFNASENNGMAFLVMFENNGQGTFKKKEYPIDGQVDFRALTDWNADGTYEVLCDMELDWENYDSPVGFIPSYTINGLKVSTEPEKIEIHSSVLNNWRHGLRLMGVWDPANDGRTRFMLTSYMALPDAPANTPPAAPASPALAYDEATGELTVTWSRGSDKETAAADLTYELRVGTTPGDDNLVRVAATADGKRLNALPGNCGYTLKRKFNTASWPRGEIYVSVQAIDDGGLGSEFSTPAKFLKTAVPAEFSVEAPRGIAIYEELTLQINSLLEADATVAWDLGDGEVLAKNAENATVRFRTPGKKSITLRVTLPDGSTGTSSKEIDIAPVRFENTEHTFDIALDLDLDGKMEAHASSFMEGDDAGNYTNVKAIFNTKNYYHLNSADINRDGLPDLIHDSGHLTNAGDKTMDDTTPDNFKKHTFFPDLNNDGFREVYSATGQGGILQNSGNYVDFIEIDKSTFNSTDVQFFDFNGDGLTDAFHLIKDYQFGGLSPISEPMRYENLGNFRFRAEPLPMEIDGLQFYYWLVGDFDGNGKADFICMKSGGGYFVLWDNNERTELTRFEDKTGIKFANHVFDYDNNGCMDVFASNDGTMVMFYPDHSVDYVEATGFYSSVFLPFTRTDGVPGVNNAIVRSAPNEKPSAPTGVKGEIIGGNLVISWNAATDKETPSAALRYNLSVKKKSAEGEGAYVISPLNGGVNGVDVPNDAHLIGATRFPIPLFALPKGEYEVKVQAVDGRRTTGDFSVPAYITIETSGYDAPAETSVGATTPITFGADVNIHEVDFGEDGVLESVSGTTAYVYWT